MIFIFSYLLSLIGHIVDNLCWFDTDSNWNNFKKSNLIDKIKFILIHNVFWIATNIRDIFSTLIGGLLLLMIPNNFWFGWIYATLVMLFSLCTNFLLWFRDRDSFWEVFGLRDIIPSVIMGFFISLIL